MKDPREVEIKLELDAGDAATLRKRGLKGLDAGPGKVERLSSVYFDTPKHSLRKKHLALRVRSSSNGDGHIQTVKARNGANSGIFDRAEWETPVAGPEPSKATLADTPVADVLRKRQRLAPVFETVVDRTSWTVPAGSSTVEIALDQGRVVAGDASRSFAELELELKSGTPGDLFEVAHKLSKNRPFRLGVLTKSERGYALIENEAHAAFKAEPVNLSPEMDTGAAFRAIAHTCIRQFRLNEALLLEHRSVESLHEARVGMRRLRSALSLFGPLVADSKVDALKRDLQAVSRTLGQARNLDVYIESAILPELDRDPSEPGVFAFFDHVQSMREKAYDEVVATLNGAPFRRLMLDLLAWVEAGPWLASDDPSQAALRKQPIVDAASDMLETRFRKLCKKGRHLAELDAASRHRVRIQAKKLRYAAEFFSGLNRNKASRQRYERFLKHMKHFQEHLGELNDMHTGHVLASDLARDAAQMGIASGQLLFAAGHLSGAQDERVAALLAAASTTFESVAAEKPFWRRWAD